MVTIFNRRELLSTFSIKEQGEIRDILSQNNIDYHMKTVNRNSPSAMSAGSRGRTGTCGQNPAYECEYTIYVKKGDYEAARFACFSR